MSKNGIRVEEFNIYSLGAEAVSYHLKNIHTLALQVTREKIGGLSLELEVELTYGIEGEPRLSFWAARGTKNEPENDRNIIVQPGDWLVILWDEIHMFKDEDFRSTFSFDGLSAPAEKELREYAEADAKDTANLFEPPKTVGEQIQQYVVRNQIKFEMGDTEKTQIVPAAGNLYPEGEGPKSYVDDEGVRRQMPTIGIETSESKTSAFIEVKD